MDSLAFKKTVAVPSLPVASAAMKGVLAHLSTDDKPYWCNGVQWIDLTLVGPGGGGGAVTGSAATVDFGAVPRYAGSFQIVDVSATVGDKYMVTPVPDGDEYEMDTIIFSAHCISNGTITVYAHAVPGPVTGIKNLIYIKV
jgi:hypothetical protein